MQNESGAPRDPTGGVMRVWTLSINGELDGIFGSEEKALEARRQHLATGIESGSLTVMSIGQWVVR